METRRSGKTPRRARRTSYRDDKRRRHPLFMRVKTGRDEQPQLIEDEGNRQHQTCERADLHGQHEGLEARRVHELHAAGVLQIVIERHPDEALNAADKQEGDRTADDQPPHARDQSLPELIEMIQKRHLRARVFEDVRVGQMDVSIVVVIGRRLGGAGEGHECHSFRVVP